MLFQVRRDIFDQMESLSDYEQQHVDIQILSTEIFSVNKIVQSVTVQEFLK